MMQSIVQCYVKVMFQWFGDNFGLMFWIMIRFDFWFYWMNEFLLVFFDYVFIVFLLVGGGVLVCIYR